MRETTNKSLLLPLISFVFNSRFFFTPQIFFTKFAFLITFTVTFSFLWAILFMPAVLLVVGPEGNFGNWTAMLGCLWRGRKVQPSED
jgi:hypothetical protein